MTDLSRRINDFLKPYLDRVLPMPADMVALALLKEAVEAIAARDDLIAANATVAKDRDAAWRMARAAADGHDHNRQVLAEIARAFGRADDWDTLPGRVYEVLNEAAFACAERDATARLLDDARREADQLRTLAVELKAALRGGVATHEAAADRVVVVRFEPEPMGGLRGCAWLTDGKGNEIAKLADARIGSADVAERSRRGTLGLIIEFPAASVNPGPKPPVSGA